MFFKLAQLLSLLALAIYSRSPAAYDALKSFNILNLPSRSTMQAYTSCFLHEGWEFVSKQVSLHGKFKQNSKKAGKKMPMGDEVLILMRLK